MLPKKILLYITLVCLGVANVALGQEETKADVDNLEVAPQEGEGTTIGQLNTDPAGSQDGDANGGDAGNGGDTGDAGNAGDAVVTEPANPPPGNEGDGPDQGDGDAAATPGIGNGGNLGSGSNNNNGAVNQPTSTDVVTPTPTRGPVLDPIPDLDQPINEPVGAPVQQPINNPTVPNNNQRTRVVTRSRPAMVSRGSTARVEPEDSDSSPEPKGRPRGPRSTNNGFTDEGTTSTGGAGNVGVTLGVVVGVAAMAVIGIATIRRRQQAQQKKKDSPAFDAFDFSSVNGSTAGKRSNLSEVPDMHEPTDNVGMDVVSYPPAQYYQNQSKHNDSLIYEQSHYDVTASMYSRGSAIDYDQSYAPESSYAAEYDQSYAPETGYNQDESIYVPESAMPQEYVVNQDRHSATMLSEYEENANQHMTLAMPQQVARPHLKQPDHVQSEYSVQSSIDSKVLNVDAFPGNNQAATSSPTQNPYGNQYAEEWSQYFHK